LKLKGSEMLIAALEKEGIDTVFGYPGGAVLTLYDSLHQSSLKHILARHEQGAIHAADGYARIAGKPGVVFATSGPGATNLVTGIANAHMDSVPLVIITGQVPTFLIGTDAFQEADITGISIPIVKHNYLVKDIRELPRIIKEAFHLASTGRPGPVLIDLPKDLQEQKGEFVYPEEVDIPGYKPNLEGHPGQITRAVKAIQKARSPVILGGGGIVRSGANSEIKQIAQQGKIPVILTLMGLGAFPASDPLYLGMPGMHGTRAANYALMEADLIIAVGVRFDDRVTGKLESFASQAKVIHIDIDPVEIGKNIVVDIPIVGDLKRVTKSLLAKLKPGDTINWIEKVNQWDKTVPIKESASKEGRIKPQWVIKKICEITEGKALVATDVGQHQMWTAQHYRFEKPRGLVTSGGLGTMGFGFPAALGVQVACPQDTVFCISGDGSFQMNIQELATMVGNRLPIKIAIMNNRCLGMVRQWQELFYQKRYSHSIFEDPPDFAKIADAYGAKGMKIEEPEEVEKALHEALQVEGPVVMDFRVDPWENVFPMVAPNQPISKFMDKGGGQ